MFDQLSMGFVSEVHTFLSCVQQVGRPENWPPDTTYVGMPGNAARAFGITDSTVGPFGKPWYLKQDPRGWAPAYVQYLVERMAHDPSFEDAVRSLHGRTLLCWCITKKAPCHGRILLEFVELLNGCEA